MPLVLINGLMFTDALSLAQEAVPTENPVRMMIRLIRVSALADAGRRRDPDARDADPEAKTMAFTAGRCGAWNGREGGIRTRDLPVPNRRHLVNNSSEGVNTCLHC